MKETQSMTMSLQAERRGSEDRGKERMGLEESKSRGRLEGEVEGREGGGRVNLLNERLMT